MRALSGLRMPPASTRTGRLARLPLRLLRPTTVVRVLSGPLRGMRWVSGSAPHGAWLGTLEREKLRHFVHGLRPGMTVWDIGAHVGLYALASARALTAGGTVYAFEPLRQNLELLRRHIALNDLANVEVCETAVGDCSGLLRMSAGDSPSEFHADPTGPFWLPVCTLDDWLESTGARPAAVVKIDAEGSEAAILRGGARVFATHRPRIYLALHGDTQRRECKALLQRWGYRIAPVAGHGDPDLTDEWIAEAS